MAREPDLRPYPLPLKCATGVGELRAMVMVKDKGLHLHPEFVTYTKGEVASRF